MKHEPITHHIVEANRYVFYDSYVAFPLLALIVDEKFKTIAITPVGKYWLENDGDLENIIDLAVENRTTLTRYENKCEPEVYANLIALWDYFHNGVTLIASE